MDQNVASCNILSLQSHGYRLICKQHNTGDSHVVRIPPPRSRNTDEPPHDPEVVISFKIE